MAIISKSNDIRDKRTYTIIGAAMEVHRHLGSGFLEPVYQEALAIEFQVRKISFKREVDITPQYKGQSLRCGYRVDFICFDNILVELKALDGLTSIEEAQIINYLRASNLEIGLLINFGALSLQHHRYANSKNNRENVLQPDSDNSYQAKPKKRNNLRNQRNLRINLL